MNKLTGIVILAALLISLAACGNKTEEKETAPDGAAPVTKESTEKGPEETEKTPAPEIKAQETAPAPEMPAGEPADVWADADLSHSLLQFGFFDGRQGEIRYMNQSRFDILKSLRAVKAYPAGVFTADMMEYPVYSIGTGFGLEGVQYLWTNGYLVAWDGSAYIFGYDFSALEDIASDVPAREITSAAELELSYLLVKDENGWIPGRMRRAEETETAGTVSLSISRQNRENVTLELENKGEDSWTYGRDYWLEVFLDGSWYRVPVTQCGGLFFTAEGYLLKPGQKAKAECSLAPFRPLPPGRYRFVKDISRMNTAGLNARQDCRIEAEFTLSAWDEAAEEAALKEEYPQYFGLETGKGLEVYIWTGSWLWDFRCVILPGTNREKTRSEVLAMPSLDIAQARAVLDSYGLPQENVFVCLIGNAEGQTGPADFYRTKVAPAVSACLDGQYRIEVRPDWK